MAAELYAAVAIGQKGFVRIEDIGKGYGGVTHLSVKESGAAGGIRGLTQQGIADAADVFEEFQLKRQQLVRTGIGSRARNLCGQGLAATHHRDDAVGTAPSFCNFFPGHQRRFLRHRKQQYAFGAGSHHLVYEHDKAVDVFLLLDNVFDKRMDFAVCQRIEFDGKGV